MSIKLVDSLSPMGSFPVAEAKDIEFADGERLQQKLDNGTLGGDGASYKQLSQAEYDALTDDEKMDGREYRTYDTGHIYKLGIEYGKDGVQISDNETVKDKTWSSQKTSDEIAKVETELKGNIEEINDSLVDKQDFRIFKSLEEFNEKKGTSLTVVSGIDNMKDIVNAMSNGEMLIITISYVSASEIYFGLDSSTGWTKMFTFIKANGLCDVECRTTSPSTFKRVLNADGVIGAWQELATKTITTLAELGLTSSATVDDVHDKLAIGQMAILQVRAFDNYQTLFPYEDSNDQYARIEIQKGKSTTHSRIFWFRKDGSKFAMGNINSNNKLAGWNEYALKSYVDSKIADLQAQINALK